MTTQQHHQQQMGRGWRERAACRGVDPELFFPTAESGPARRVQVSAAKAVCARCPVRERCLTEALAHIPYGIAGGLTEHERRRLRQARPTSGGAGVAAAGATAEDVLVAGMWAGLCADLSRSQRARVGRWLLASGRTPGQVARVCGVSDRTAYRWASTSTTGMSATGTDGAR